MICNSPKKAPEKITKGKAKYRTQLNLPNENRSRRKTMLAAICVLTIFVFGAFEATGGSSKSIVYASTVNGLGAGIYWDQACTNRTLSLTWGSVEAGSNTTITIYVKNEGNLAAPLTLETSNWNPTTATNCISLNWNYSGQALSPGQVIPIEITLTVSPNIIGIANFSFNTIITANQI